MNFSSWQKFSKGRLVVGEEPGKRRTTVLINGQNYVISGKADVSHIHEVANFVDQKMKEMRKINPYLDKTQLAVLTAVNISDEYLRLRRQMEQERKKRDGEK
jgi:cell division protein ZapA